MTRAMRVILAVVAALSAICDAPAQIDPFKRELVQVGYNMPVEGNGPLNAYAFYFLNVPNFTRSNLTLRLALAPVYLDSEVGLSHLLGEHTDLGLGVSGGGFADTYSEVRRGKYIRAESFTGNGGSFSASVYHLFNPGDQIPLNGVFRLEPHFVFYDKDSKTASNFMTPEDGHVLHLRTGFRWGGKEPVLLPELAMEISAWYELQVRSNSGRYGTNLVPASPVFNGDRDLKPVAHLFWARALLAYTFPECKHNFLVSLTAGTSADSDRFSAYRLGGVLPMAAEFPLTLPGYYFQEISARDFLLFGCNYSVPLDRNDRFAINALATTAVVNYITGLEQPGHWHTGLGGGIRYRSPHNAWQIVLGYGYGVDAIREHGRGAHSIGFLLQFDLERAHVELFEPGDNPLRSRGLERIFGNWF